MPHPFAVVALRAGRTMESKVRLHPNLAMQHSMIAPEALLPPKHEQHPCHHEVVGFISRFP
jgi:aspartate carbamoyltransferase catalytic subunit